MYLDENSKIGNETPSLMDSPTLARVERALQRQEGKNIYRCQVAIKLIETIERLLYKEAKDYSRFFFKPKSCLLMQYVVSGCSE